MAGELIAACIDELVLVWNPLLRRMVIHNPLTEGAMKKQKAIQRRTCAAMAVHHRLLELDP